MERKLELFLETRLVLPEHSCGITTPLLLERLLSYSRVRHVLSRSTSKSNLWKEEKSMRPDVKSEKSTKPTTFQPNSGSNNHDLQSVN